MGIAHRERGFPRLSLVSDAGGARDEDATGAVGGTLLARDGVEPRLRPRP